jgi:hypothetical protein
MQRSKVQWLKRSSMKRTATHAALPLGSLHKKKRVHFADDKQDHDTEKSRLVLDFDSIIDFCITGFTTVRESCYMRDVAGTAVNIIGRFLSHLITGNSTKIPLTYSDNMDNWKRVTEEGIYGYVPMHFHPFILKHITLSTDNYYRVGQLTGHTYLHTMMEGCTVRPQASARSAIMINADTNVITPVVCSLYVVSVSDLHKNGGPEFLTHWVLYRRLINVLFDLDSGFKPNGRMFHHNKRVTHQYNERDIALINAFISIYTTYTHRHEVADSFDVLCDLHRTTFYKDLIPFVIDVYTKHAFTVPVTTHIVRWIQPSLADGTWLYYDRRTPMRWRSNISKYPFIAIEASLYHMRNDRLSQIDVKHRLSEFRNIRICSRRYKSTTDLGDEQKWAVSSDYKLNHDVCDDGVYNRPSLGYVRSRMLGVDLLNQCRVRWI